MRRLLALSFRSEHREFPFLLLANKTMSKKKIAVIGALSLTVIVAIVVVLIVVVRDYNGIGEGDPFSWEQGTLGSSLHSARY